MKTLKLYCTSACFYDARVSLKALQLTTERDAASGRSSEERLLHAHKVVPDLIIIIIPLENKVIPEQESAGGVFM